MIIHKSYDELFSLLNIFCAWRKFKSGKAKKYDIMSFEYHLEDNLFSLYDDLKDEKYKHSGYIHFKVFDSKKRDIHKACVRDRIVHQIIFDYLEGIFEPIFISDSYSSRKNKGSHKAVKTFRYFAKLIQSDGRNGCFVLKCDARKYFESVNKDILLGLIRKKVQDDKIFEVVRKIVCSFIDGKDAGMPLGNITSQVFANIYLDRLDYFMKKELRARFYIRYNDDFVVLDHSRERLDQYLPRIRNFLESSLYLEIPDEKASIRKLDWGVDFLGYVILKDCILIRNKTKGKIFERMNQNNITSYLGLLKHCNSYTLTQKVIFYLNSVIL